MSLRYVTCVIATSAVLLFSSDISAHEYKVGDLTIGHPYSHTTVPGQPTAGAFLSIENHGKNDDKLTAVTSPIAKSAELHTMSMDGDIMKMREVQDIGIKSTETLTMKPGSGYHIMLFGLQHPLKAGDQFPMTLTFEKAGKVDVSVHVETTDAKHEHTHH